ncbi:ATP synthase F0 subcomplex A subunit [Humitalea rosea]|uniref:ATP synthase subunit a n=1 Tax=Humitalea rosea TaxID=990373 RepID=A0A2W7IJ24_9PROT|nr:F0F1 ATP synthase subunit A [Humitalea rosea]PZW39337.1 ATP synthase F0 subcomplex A subunit [Humitalea rosea]
MMDSPLSTHLAFTLGPVPISTTVLTTWGIMAALAAAAWAVTRRLTMRPGTAQACLELVVETIQGQIHDTMHTASTLFLPLIGTLFLFILAANWSSMVPGIEPPTAKIETDAALALIVFLSVVGFGIQARGLGGYLRSFAYPNLFLVPMNLLEQFTRTFALVVRLFGNVMSGVFIIAILLSLVGLLVPVPLMALELLTGAVQAYIFAVLAMVFISGAIEEKPSDAAQQQEDTAS